MTGRPLPGGTVTFLFSDIERSTDLVRRFRDDVFAAIRDEHRRLLRGAFDEHGGREVDTAGDGFFVAFDSARAAVAAAAAVQRSLAGYTWPAGAEVRVRIGLHTAEPYLDANGYVGIGVHRAARICDAAHGGQILVSNATAGIVADAELLGVELLDLGEHRLKGLPGRQRLFQLTVQGLPSAFDRPRTADAGAQGPGVGTFVAIDLSGWRHMIPQLGDEASAAALAEYYATVTAAVEADNGIVIECAGDNVLAVFRQATEAVRAAAAIRAALTRVGWLSSFKVGVKIFIHSGRWSGDSQRLSASTAMLRLMRLGEIVQPGQVLVSHTTAALMEGDNAAPDLHDLGEHKFAEFEQPVHVYELAQC